MDNYYPIRFAPIYRDYIWGGDRIVKKYHRDTNAKRIAESWEVADRKEGMSVVMNGPLKGKTLHQLVEEMGEDLIGKGRDCSSFPLLVKILDARENLSIQVHPNHETAPLLEGEPKTEMWYILDTDSKAAVYSGLKPGVYEEKFLESIRTHQIPDLLDKIEVQMYDAIYIPGGRVHAICAGCLLLEVQQNSDTTYRIYDWDRKVVDGQERELHLKEALAAIDWKAGEAKAIPKKIYSDLHHTLWMAVSSPYFIVQRVEIYDAWRIPHHADTFQIFFCMEGEASIIADGTAEELLAGMTYIIPAACSSGEIRGRCQVIWITLDGYR
jgi:mannose-6-phosphate isomerase